MYVVCMYVKKQVDVGLQISCDGDRL